MKNPYDSNSDTLEKDISVVVDKVTFSDTNNIDSFQNVILKRMFPNLTKVSLVDIEIDLNSLILFVNIHLNLLKEFLDLIKNSDYYVIRSEIEAEYKNHNIENMLNNLKLKNLHFDKKNFYLYQENEAIQINILNEKKLNKHFHDFLVMTSIEQKEEKMNFFSNKIADTLNDIKKDIEYKNVISKYFDDKNISTFILMCQGYFRHPKKIIKHIAIKNYLNIVKSDLTMKIIQKKN